MSDKHYHNDYKKIMGVDETRTASEKLLDRNFSKRDAPNIIEPIDEPKKKVKKENLEGRELSSQEIVDKIVKNIKNSNLAAKNDKALSIFEKCLDENEFVERLESSSIINVIECLMPSKFFAKGSLGELIKLAETENRILQKLKTVIAEKHSDLEVTNKKISYEILLLNLITDDSFSFAKHTQVLKQKLFDFYSQLTEASDPQKESQAKNDYGENEEQQKSHKEVLIKEAEEKETISVFIEESILSKILNLPNIHLDWVRTGISNLIKEFNVNYKNQLKNSKSFLAAFNKFLQEKKTGQELSSSDIMGSKRSNNGGAYTIVEHQDATSSWCKRQ